MPKSVLLSLSIDSAEGRDVATADIAGAYLFADMSDFTLVKLVGESAEIMCNMNPAYCEFLVQEGRNKVLYLQLAKALYGCLKSALLWYQT